MNSINSYRNIFKILYFLFIPLIFLKLGLALAIIYAGLTFVFLIIPDILVKKTKKRISLSYAFLANLLIIVVALGFYFDYFNDDICFWWDEFCYFLAVIVSGLLVAEVFFKLQFFGKLELNKMSKFFFMLFTLFGIAAVWETVEFLAKIQNGLTDTMSDLFWGGLAAIIISLLFTFKKKYGSNRIS